MKDITRYVSRGVEYNNKFFQHLTTFLIFTWWGHCENNPINWIPTIAFWATCKIDSTANSAHSAATFLSPKKPIRELNFLQVFSIHSSRINEKLCQMLDRLFVVFLNTINLQWLSSFIISMPWVFFLSSMCLLLHAYILVNSMANLMELQAWYFLVWWFIYRVCHGQGFRKVCKFD